MSGMRFHGIQCNVNDCSRREGGNEEEGRKRKQDGAVGGEEDKFKDKKDHMEKETESMRMGK